MDALWRGVPVLALLVGGLIVLGTLSAARDWLSHAVRRNPEDR